jgi:hypothetical protein
MVVTGIKSLDTRSDEFHGEGRTRFSYFLNFNDFIKLMLTG